MDVNLNSKEQPFTRADLPPRSHRGWTYAVYALVDGVHVGDPTPAEGGGFWIKPLWRFDKFYVCGVRVPVCVAWLFGRSRWFHF